MRSLIKRAVLFLIMTGSLLSLPAVPVRAGVISVQTELAPSYDGKTFRLQATVINRGDDPAHEVSVTAELAGTKAHSSEVAFLGPNESQFFELAQDLPVPNHGEYPVVVTVNYSDANRYPFSAISIAPVAYGDSQPSRVAAALSNLEISDGNGHLKLSTRNSGGQAQEITARLITPRELAASGFVGRVTLDGGAAEDFRIPIANVSANPGSSYQVYALVEYDEGGLHHSTVANAYVNVILDPGFLKSHKVLLISLCVMVGLGFLYTNIRFLFRQGRQNAPLES